MPLDHRISLQKLEVLCLVVELGGVHRAAERLFVSQPVVSAHLRSLQERVGAPLLVKQGRRLALTEAGQAVYDWAKEVLARREELAREIDDMGAGESGRAVVAASISVGNYHLPGPLIDFSRRHPQARITLLMSDPDTALRRTEEGECDFCIVVTDAPIDRRTFLAEPIGRDELVLIAAPDSDLPDVVPIDALAELPAVCPPGGIAIRRIQDAALHAAGVFRRPVAIELGSGEAIKQAVAAGLGVALLSRAAVRDEIGGGRLREIRIDGVALDQRLLHVQRRSKRLSPVQSGLLATIRVALSTTDSRSTMDGAQSSA